MTRLDYCLLNEHFRSDWLKISSQNNKCCCHFEKQMLSPRIYCLPVKTILQKTNLSEVWRTPSNGGNFLRVTKEYPWRKVGLRNLKNSTEKQANSQKAHRLVYISKKNPISHLWSLWIVPIFPVWNALSLSTWGNNWGSPKQQFMETLVQFLLHTGILPPELTAQNMTQAF